MPAVDGLSLVFRSQAVADGTLLVTKLVGIERISGVYELVVDLVAQDANLDLEDLVYQRAQVGVRHRLELGGEQVFQTRWMGGVCASVSVMGEEESWMRYQARIVPQLWMASQSYRSRVFLDGTTPRYLSQVLSGYGLAEGADFEFRTAEPARDYVVQYEESDLAFLSRWLEHEGFHYYFLDQGEGERLIFGDSTAYPPIEGDPTVRYLRQGPGARGQDGRAVQDEEVVRSFVCTQNRLPGELTLNDYNWRDPSQPLRSTTVVHPRGEGVHYEYNNHYKTLSEGRELAKRRADELTCRERVYRGDSNCAGFRPGLSFSLQGHPRYDLNQTYVLTGVRHEAVQGVALTRGGALTGASYTNTFEAIPADRIYRPERKTPWPRIRGVMHAKVDAEGEGEYAEIDDLGRYKVQIPFDQDLGERDPGKASRYMRMAQPYAGVDSGMHFPLLKGTEILLAHVDGHPDRPIIAHAVPNPETVSPVDASTHTKNRIRTTSGNLFEMDDDAERAGFWMQDAAGTDVTESRTAVTGLSSISGGGGGGAVRSRRRRRSARRPEPAKQPVAEASGDPEEADAAPGDPPAERTADDLPGAGLGADEILESTNAAGEETTAWASFQSSVTTTQGLLSTNAVAEGIDDPGATYVLRDKFNAVTSLTASGTGRCLPSGAPAFPDWCNASFPGWDAENFSTTSVDGSDNLVSGAKLIGVNKNSRVEVRNGNQYVLEHAISRIRYLDINHDIVYATGGYNYERQTGAMTDEGVFDGDVIENDYYCANFTDWMYVETKLTDTMVVNGTADQADDQYSWEDRDTLNNGNYFSKFTCSNGAYYEEFEGSKITTKTNSSGNMSEIVECSGTSVYEVGFNKKPKLHKQHLKAEKVKNIVESDGLIHDAYTAVNIEDIKTCVAIAEVTTSGFRTSCDFFGIFNETKIGIALLNAITIAPNVSDLMLATKLEVFTGPLLQIRVGTDWEVDLATYKAAVLQQQGFLNRAKACLTELGGAVQKSDAAVTQNRAALQRAQTALQETKAALQHTHSALTRTEAALTHSGVGLARQRTALNLTNTALSYRATGLNVNLGV